VEAATTELGEKGSPYQGHSWPIFLILFFVVA
jgi:hypothetical protein